MNGPRLVLFLATQRGVRVFEHLQALLPNAAFLVFSFREEPVEPPYFDRIGGIVESSGNRFVDFRNTDSPEADLIESHQPDLMLAVSWRYLIPAGIFTRAKRGAFVIHDSLLPHYRGFSPTVWSIRNGENILGATLFEMTEEVDAGDIVGQSSTECGADETIADVMPRITEGYLQLLTRHLPALLKGDWVRIPQDHRLATFGCRRIPEDNVIDWRDTAASIHNLIRAVTAPYAGAYTTLGGKKLIVWQAKSLPSYRRFSGVIPGRVVEILPSQGAVVLTGGGALLLVELQLEGQPARPAKDILNSLRLTLGR